MSKIGKALRALALISKNPYLLNAILNHEDVKKALVEKKFHLSNGLPVVNLETLFPNFEQLVTPYSYLSGMTLPIDLALLKALAEKIKAEKYFEIGTWRGESVANVASVVPQCFSMNLSREEILSLGYPQEYADLHCFFSEKLHNVTQLWGNSNHFDFSPYFGQYDLIFVDGDHHAEAVCRDTRTAFKLRRNEQSIIVWHDYALDTETIRWSVLSGILEGCPEECRKNLYHVSNTLCAVYLPFEVASHPLIPFEKPQRFFDIHISLKEIE